MSVSKLADKVAEKRLAEAIEIAIQFGWLKKEGEQAVRITDEGERQVILLIRSRFREFLNANDFLAPSDITLEAKGAKLWVQHTYGKRSPTELLTFMLADAL